MDLQLDGKRALVTGSSQGIGVGIAKMLAAEGAVVVVHGRNRERTEGTAREIEEAGGRAVVAVADLTTDEGADAVAAVVNDTLGGLDILVNNMGDAGPEPRGWAQIPPADYLAAYNLNFVAALRLVHRFAPAMMDRGWGRIINISSVISRQAKAMLLDYAAAKIALENLSLNLSMEMAKRGVTVNTVTPGSILTAGNLAIMTKLGEEFGWPEDPAERQKRFMDEYAPQPVPRLGVPDDIGFAVLYFASPRSSYATGAILRVDGGMTFGL